MSKEQEYFDALKRIAAYQTPQQLHKSHSKDWGLDDPNEAIEMAYENVLSEAKNAIKGHKWEHKMQSSGAVKFGSSGATAPHAKREHKMALPEYEDRMAVLLAENARLREALEPFARAADRFDPEEGDDNWDTWGVQFKIGDLRRARAVARQSNDCATG